jgi:uncharacterized protein (DUF488 family)
VIVTAGHSNLDRDSFLDLLRSAPVDLVWDVRSFPVSRFVWFRREQLEQWLPAAGIEYRWVAALGGRRAAPPAQRRHPPAEDSTTTAPDPPAEPFALRDPHAWSESGFAAYELHTTTDEFLRAALELIETGAARDVAIMCAEALWWRCHRSMIADFLVFAGNDAVHLQPKRQAHSEAIGDRLSRYDPETLAVWRRRLEAGARP